MFNSTILDVLVGLIFVFLVVSLVASAVTEAFASLVKLRSSTLLTGIQELLNDPKGTGIAKELYNHALISPRDTGGKADTSQMRLIPAYIDPTQFADAMIEVTKLLGKTAEQMPGEISSSELLSPQTKDLLSGMVTRAQGNVESLRAELATWFDSAMDRVGGAYKRRTQLIGFVVALSLTGVLNIDTIAVAKALWLQPMMTKSIDLQKIPEPRDALAKLESLPLAIGWDMSAQSQSDANDKPRSDSTRFLMWATRILGWLITAVASLFGAPFWYDALQSFVRIKGAGPSPAEKRTGAGAAA
jgi:hypothetical protein